MPLAELEQAAETIYGAAWQTALARDLDVAPRTVRRWAAGAMRPADVRGDLVAVCRRRIKELLALIDRLEGRSALYDHRKERPR